MAKILEFKLPVKKAPSEPVKNIIVSSSIDDVMLMIHHALHGSEANYQPKDQQLASNLLDELSAHIKNNLSDNLTLSYLASQEILQRYPNECHVKTQESGS